MEYWLPVQISSSSHNVGGHAIHRMWDMVSVSVKSLTRGRILDVYPIASDDPQNLTFWTYFYVVKIPVFALIETLVMIAGWFNDCFVIWSICKCIQSFVERRLQDDQRPFTRVPGNTSYMQNTVSL